MAQNDTLVNGWQPVIGLEIHVQLQTNTKLFSPAKNQFGEEANTLVDLIDMGLPGVLPVLNDGAVKQGIAFGLACDGGDDRGRGRARVLGGASFVGEEHKRRWPAATQGGAARAKGARRQGWARR